MRAMNSTDKKKNFPPMKKIILLGSTGSIGTNVLKVVDHLNSPDYQVVALAAHSSIDLLYEQAKKFRPKIVAVYDKSKALELKKRLPDFHVVGGLEGLLEAASFSEGNLVFNAIVGTDGLQPMLEALKAKKNVALANKEVLVSAGDLVMKTAQKNGCTILPVDSEHSAIFQCLQGYQIESVRKLILTASGGPFFRHDEKALKEITLEQALNHPTWKMGAKVTVDSSTLMNKGFEVIEAHYLFGIPLKNIEVLIHPQSIVHSLVEFVDNALLAQLGEPQMLTPIQIALTYPDKKPGLLKPFDFTRFSKLEFYQPDTNKFQCLAMAYEALRLGGSYSCYLNAINETLVERFLKKQLSWYDIGLKLRMLMDKHTSTTLNSLSDVLELDQLARTEALEV